MNNIIKQIIEIEEMGQEVIAPAKEREIKLDEIINEEIEKKNAEILKKIKKEKEERIKECDDETSKLIIKFKESAARKISSLEEKYKQNKEDWEDKLFESIINTI